MPAVLKTVMLQFCLPPSQIIKPTYEGGPTTAKLDTYEARELALDLLEAVSDNTGDSGLAVKILLLEGRHIDAIKAHRTNTGVGLKEAKDHCDSLRDKLIAL